MFGDIPPLVTDAFLLQENARLRAELAAERERVQGFCDATNMAISERDEALSAAAKLRAALVKARPFLSPFAALAAIDAVLNETKGGGDE
jgi:hypothetical protein